MPILCSNLHLHHLWRLPRLRILYSGWLPLPQPSLSENPAQDEKGWRGEKNAIIDGERLNSFILQIPRCANKRLLPQLLRFGWEEWWLQSDVRSSLSSLLPPLSFALSSRLIPFSALSFPPMHSDLTGFARAVADSLIGGRQRRSPGFNTCLDWSKLYYYYYYFCKNK